MLNSLAHHYLVGFSDLLPCHSVLCIAGIIHDPVGKGEDSAGIESAAHGLGKFSAACLLTEINMCYVIEIDDGTDPVCIFIFLKRSIV